MKIALKRVVEAEQYVVGMALPQGCFLCQPELNWSHGRDLVYYTFADFTVKHWLGVQQLAVPEGTTKLNEGFEGHVIYKPREGKPAYMRKWLSFMFWKVKSEASATQNHRPVYYDKTDELHVALFNDYASAEEWPNPLPRCIEYREVNGSYGRGFRPVYLKPTDWLIFEDAPIGHNNLGTQKVVRVMQDAEFQASLADGRLQHEP